MHEIEVWCASTRRWVRGFWFEALVPEGGIRVRRGIDQRVLPGVFSSWQVRPAPRLDLRSGEGRPRRSALASPRPAGSPA